MEPFVSWHKNFLFGFDQHSECFAVFLHIPYTPKLKDQPPTFQADRVPTCNFNSMLEKKSCPQLRGPKFLLHF